MNWSIPSFQHHSPDSPPRNWNELPDASSADLRLYRKPFRTRSKTAAPSRKCLAARLPWQGCRDRTIHQCQWISQRSLENTKSGWYNVFERARISSRHTPVYSFWEHVYETESMPIYMALHKCIHIHIYIVYHGFFCKRRVHCRSILKLYIISVYIVCISVHKLYIYHKMIDNNSQAWHTKSAFAVTMSAETLRPTSNQVAVHITAVEPAVGTET